MLAAPIIRIPTLILQRILGAHILVLLPHPPLPHQVLQPERLQKNAPNAMEPDTMTVVVKLRHLERMRRTPVPIVGSPIRLVHHIVVNANIATKA